MATAQVGNGQNTNSAAEQDPKDPQGIVSRPPDYVDYNYPGHEGHPVRTWNLTADECARAGIG